MFAGWTIEGYELNTAQTGTTSDSLATLTEAVAETVGTKNMYFKNLTSLDINEVADEKDATITFSAQWVEVPSNAYAKDIITPAMYGDKVNYNANGVSDWKIFLNDDSNVYILPSNVVPVNSLNLANGMTLPEGAIGPVTYAGRASRLNWLTNKDYWNNYASGIIVKNEAATAIGGPTLTQWIQSWNSRGYVALYSHEGELGYTVSFSESEISNNGVWLADSLGYNDPLYFPSHGSNTDTYWLATASGANDSFVVLVDGFGDVYGYHNQTGLGIRPLVCLPTSTKMTWNGTAWDIDPSQLTGAITAQNYGDKVDYSVTVNGEVINDWKLFLKENDSIYLISGDLINNTLLPESSNIKTRGSYRIYATDNSTTLLNYLQGNGTNWESFCNKYAVSAVGAPTCNQFRSSCNSKYGEIYSSAMDWVDLSSKVVYGDKLYFPHKEMIDDECRGYYLATLKKDDGNYLMGEHFSRKNRMGLPL